MTCHPAICHMRQVTFAASVHFILLITGPVKHAVEQRLTRRYNIIVADDWRFGNVNERAEEEMMTQEPTRWRPYHWRAFTTHRAILQYLVYVP
jgi:hypothetical protein